MASEKKMSGNGAYYARIIGTLFVITVIVSVILACVNMVTKPTIDRLAEEKRLASMAAVMPGDNMTYTLTDATGDGIVGINLAEENGAVKGYCVQVSTNGFGGAISMMVGVDTDCKVTGVEILSMSETAGLGSRASESDFRAQYVGLTGTINVKSGDNAITPISGATVTSKAVTLGVNNAIAAVENNFYLDGGAN